MAGKKTKRKRALAQLEVAEVQVGDESSDEGPTPMKKRTLKRVLSSDSDGEQSCEIRREPRTSKRMKVPTEEVMPSKKRKVLRCEDSSDEENAATPKAERVNKLLEMRKKLQAKKKVKYDSSDNEASEVEDWLVEDEDNLPMWENEEVPPQDVVDESECEGNMDDFIVDDEVDVESKPKKTKDNGKLGKSKDVELDGDHDLSDAEKKLKRKKRKKSGSAKEVIDGETTGEERTGVGRRKSKKIAESEDEASENSEDETETDYGNPYMQMNDAMESANIMDVLSKNTAKDKKNAKKYKKEMGKYQYAVHSDRNKAAQVSNRARFAANMGTVRADRGFKAERNLDIKDAEYHDYKETCLFGERVRIFPHTKRYSKYKSRCALRGCGEPFSVGETRIIGITKFCDINFRFMKKLNNFGKESFHYICERHCPKTGSDSEEYSSGDDD